MIIVSRHYVQGTWLHSKVVLGSFSDLALLKFGAR